MLFHVKIKSEFVSEVAARLKDRGDCDIDEDALNKAVVEIFYLLANKPAHEESRVLAMLYMCAVEAKRES